MKRAYTLLCWNFLPMIIMAQNVGIGTTLPECKLNVVETDPYLDVAIFKNMSANASVLVASGSQTLGLAAYPSVCRVGSFTPCDLQLTTFGLPRLTIQNSNGNVGIGTGSPNTKLHVAGSSLGGSALGNFDTGTAENAFVTFGNTTAITKIGSGMNSGFVGTSTPDPLNLMVDNVNRLYIGTDGRVGIGTTYPNCTFHVLSNNVDIESARFVNGGGTNQILIGNGTAMVGWALNNQKCWLNNTSGIDFAIQTNAVDRLFVQNGTGNIGMGTNAPTATLHVLSPTTMDQVARFEPGGGFNGYIKVGSGNNSVDLGSDFYKSYLSTSGSQDFVISTSGTERIHIKNSTGSVGIGTDNPSAKLTVLGNSNLQGTLVTTGEVSLLTNCTINGNLTVGSILQPDRIPVTWYNNNFFHNLGSPYEDVTYYKDKENRVHLSGIVETVGSQTGTMFILPSGFRPLGNQVFAQMTNSGNIIRINVNSTGNVTIQGSLNGWVTMDGISFRAQ